MENLGPTFITEFRFITTVIDTLILNTVIITVYFRNFIKYRFIVKNTPIFFGDRYRSKRYIDFSINLRIPNQITILRAAKERTWQPTNTRQFSRIPTTKRLPTEHIVDRRKASVRYVVLFEQLYTRTGCRWGKFGHASVPTIALRPKHSA